MALDEHVQEKLGIYIHWLSDMQVIFHKGSTLLHVCAHLQVPQTERFEVFPSAGMVGKQGVAAPVSCRFWDSGALYVSLCIIV
jgi:hypothetical protein